MQTVRVFSPALYKHVKLINLYANLTFELSRRMLGLARTLVGRVCGESGIIQVLITAGTARVGTSDFALQVLECGNRGIWGKLLPFSPEHSPPMWNLWKQNSLADSTPSSKKLLQSSSSATAPNKPGPVGTSVSTVNELACTVSSPMCILVLLCRGICH